MILLLQISTPILSLQHSWCRVLIFGLSWGDKRRLMSHLWSCYSEPCIYRFVLMFWFCFQGFPRYSEKFTHNKIFITGIPVRRIMAVLPTSWRDHGKILAYLGRSLTIMASLPIFSMDLGKASTFSHLSWRDWLKKVCKKTTF